ncbi:hypothetical protein HDU98_009250 [Podochytrium sp. JEL0797]|nr:hypothetical protein HDU98_009250 [Podochytrium sp. JEL0797]
MTSLDVASTPAANTKATTTAAASAAPSEPQVNAYEVGWLFVQQYYTFLNKEPNKLYFFYNSKSSFIHGTECESLDTQTNQKDIQARIAELDFQDCKVLVSNVDSQLSHNGSIVIMVLGEMSNKGGASHKFSQCFVLAEQPSGYFVYNDMFRFLKEDIDNEYEDASDPLYENDFLNAINNTIHEQPPHHPAAPLPSTAAPSAAAPATAAPAAAIPTPAKAISTPSAVAKPISPAPTPAAPAVSQQQRGRSPSPKKLPTPTPPVAALRARSPSPAKKSPIVPAAEPAAVTPAKKEDVDKEFVGSWAESVPTPTPTAATIAPTATAPAAAAPVAPSSPTKGSQQKKKTPAATKPEQPAVAPVAAPAPTPAAPPKPKTWATLVSTPATDAPAAAVAKPVGLAGKPSAEAMRAPAPAPSAAYARANAAAAASPATKIRFAPTTGSGSGSEEGFSEVQHRGGRHVGRPAGPMMGGQMQQNGSKSFQQPREDVYTRSIFFMLPDGLDENIIHDFFSKNCGTVLEVAIPRGKPLVFVEFEDVAVAAAAIGKPVIINGKNIVPEPRKPKSDSSRGGYQGRGGMQQRWSGGGIQQHQQQQQGGQRPVVAKATV